MDTLIFSTNSSSISHRSFDEYSMFEDINLDQTVAYYEEIIDRGDKLSYNYWYLGLAYLLQQREIDAQAIWFIPFAEASELETSVLTNELSAILDRLASQTLTDRDLDNSWLISQYLREVDPTHVNNLIRSILLAIELDLFSPEDLVEWEGVEILSTHVDCEVDRENLDRVVELLLNFPSEVTGDLIRQCLLSFATVRSHLIELIARTSLNLSHRLGANSFMTEILEICLKFQPQNTVVLQVLGRLNCNLAEYQKAIDISYLIYSLCDGSAQKIIGNANIIRTLLTAGDWQNVLPTLDRHYQLLKIFINEKQYTLTPEIDRSLLVSSTFLPYIADRPDYYRSIQNQISQIYLDLDRPQAITRAIEPTALPKQTEILRIGYLSSTLRSHSVGWLSRWLWQYHDRDKFQIFTYCINQNPDDPFYQKWFRDRADVAYCFGTNANEIAAQIRADDVDILIDLDSLTLDTTCQVLAAKPAPVQVSWLGWDATGLATVDYFIADRYVLPENAQEYYQEQIWRLPQSYLAVDGFEVGTPTIRREDLDIPTDAIIYWSGQRGYKRHPQTIKLQMQILKSVPNSYLLIKGESDRYIIEALFAKIAREVGVDLNRLRFLNTVADEVTHRANLAIADIVLDTFPYNGATTTLETLWMGIPMVTQVGEQFAARNSYTFMLNAGITEGIAWSEQEYVDWGVKLGLDRQLRSKVHDKLRSGRKTAPVWNAKQFTRDLEQAYQEMWSKHLATQSQSV
ncbi:O-linked N-acetylglucosamine transferase, SPINDLY family protein [Chamaesiphon sp. VAR_48_metabat_135_sub]|uniref:O-linked N-acetylglucosamine transferase, SPINDLY family protein n=1 Tax=Chamaesiphon sp. VAR_48_metabat_135_sub TaxID=2964699 RepID=UPI00286B5D7A|nr:O-linked N-acetylglucosamine transferase, SPINDLY family protein [Chamaesiphon sp. VAR_48_metabat_135_sub]